MAILQRDVRASDHDRETAVALLKAHYADGRLAEDELAWRTDAAYRAVGIRQLARLTSDLPAPPRQRPRRRPPYIALGILLLVIAAWLAAVPSELTIGLIALVVAMGMVATFLLAPIWIPALLVFVAWRVIRTR
jgi:hypothetical protein